MEETREIAAPALVRAVCPRCGWASTWTDVDSRPNALWFAEQAAHTLYRKHFDDAHAHVDSPAWETSL